MAIVTKEGKIEQAIKNAAEALSLGVKVTLDGLDTSTGLPLVIGATTKYVYTDVQFIQPIETDLSLQLDPIRQGYVLFNVNWPRAYAKIDATELAGSIMAAFKRGTKLVNGDVQVRFDEAPKMFAQPLGPSDTHRTISVTCSWRCYP